MKIMNPKYSAIPKAKITLTSASGIHEFVAISAKRGNNDQKYCLDIECIGSTKDTGKGQYYFEFSDSKYGATVKVIGTREDFSKTIISTIVNDASFWL